MLSAVLLSFEGTSLGAIRVLRRPRAGTVVAIGTLERHVLQILENCMVKNFHVPNMKAVRSRISVRVRMQFQRKRQSSLRSPKRAKRVRQVHKSTQVDTLASQAMKDVASCDKLGGAANER